MGNLLFSAIGVYDSLASFFGNRESRIMIFGLDAAGKTTLLYRMTLGEVVTTEPTIGFNVETFTYKNIKFTAWDFGGQEVVRLLWWRYLYNNDAVIFVVDSADSERMDEAKYELKKIFKEEELVDAKLLVYANKQDQPNALSAEELRVVLDLSEVTKNLTYVQPCVATTGDGVYEGLNWLSKAIKGEIVSENAS